ncbi:SDR family NAD(P)-dependent oxidoreductase [Archangium sp.]|uniref:SDR family NAD(P)-dependent oxidoreductase n=1 Tax=Archangium sp. TaxID=1872627 RepID=UPI002D4DC03C|nr:SDR family oxidoreductase [Archangium sp.]HYO56004.1 SDR family oxidoreductase [Archangium sp.]
MDLGLKDKVVFITGAAGGIGSALTRAFAAEGARVVIHYGFAQERAAARQLAREISTDSLLLQGDLSSEAQVRKVFTQARKKLGRIDVLVNNAGRSPYEGLFLSEHTPEMWEDLYRSNLLTAVLCTREFLRGLKQQGSTGNVVFISSTAGTEGEAGNAIYAAFKAAMIGLCLSVKQEGVKQLHPQASFRANVVAPGWTVTRMAAVLEFLKNRKAVVRALQTRSLPDLAEAEDVANLVTFLASDKAARTITGQTFRVDCGMDRRLQWESEELQEAYERILQRHSELGAPVKRGRGARGKSSNSGK